MFDIGWQLTIIQSLSESGVRIGLESADSGANSSQPCKNQHVGMGI